jgi:hypothetical protein
VARRTPGGYVVHDANGQALAYLYSRDNPTEALQAKMLTKGVPLSAVSAPGADVRVSGRLHLRVRLISTCAESGGQPP